MINKPPPALTMETRSSPELLPFKPIFTLAAQPFLTQTLLNNSDSAGTTNIVNFEVIRESQTDCDYAFDDGLREE